MLVWKRKGTTAMTAKYVHDFGYFRATVLYDYTHKEWVLSCVNNMNGKKVKHLILDPNMLISNHATLYEADMEARKECAKFVNMMNESEDLTDEAEIEMNEFMGVN